MVLNQAKKYFLIGITTVIVIVSILIFLAFSQAFKKSPEEKALNSQSFGDLLKNTSQNHSYVTKEFGVIYSKDNKTLFINIFKPPYDTNRQKALDWLKGQGAEPEKLNIIYTPANKFK